MAILKSAECPRCGDPTGLFICSLGGVNCGNCGEYIRQLDTAERQEWAAAVYHLEANAPTLKGGDPKLNKELKLLWKSWELYGDLTIVSFRNALGECKEAARYIEKDGKSWCSFFNEQCHSLMCKSSRIK